MNVYPINLMENTSNFLSHHIEDYSFVSNMWHPYLNYRSEFVSKSPEITCSWDRAQELDTFIVGNTNAKQCRLRVFDDSVLVFEIEHDLTRFHNIIELGEKVSGNNLIINFEGDEKIVVGLFYVGVKWTLPRFLVGPVRSLGLRTEINRSTGGQAYGFRNESLLSFSCSFARIPNNEVKVIEEYIKTVSVDAPHIIDPYYEAHEEFEPFFATVADYSEQEKVDENGFYWNFSISWMEAK